MFLREAWTLAVRDASFDVYATAEELLARCDAEPDYLARVAFVVTDYHMGGGRLGGDDLRVRLKARRADLPVALSSESGLSVGDGFDAVLEKRPYTFAELTAACS